MEEDGVEILALGQRLRELYVNERSVRSGRPFRLHKSYDSCDFWNDVARNCKYVGADPIDFIKCVFRHCKDTVFPNILKSKKIKTWYRNYTQSVSGKGDGVSNYETMIRNTITNTLKNCKQVSQKRGIPLRDVLLNEYRDMPAFVRIFLMPNDIEITTKFKSKFIKELTLNPGLDSVLKNMGLPLDRYV